MLQASAPYKSDVELCIYSTNAPTNCSGGSNGIAADITTAKGYVKSITTKSGVITVTGNGALMDQLFFNGDRLNLIRVLPGQLLAQVMLIYSLQASVLLLNSETWLIKQSQKWRDFIISRPILATKPTATIIAAALLALPLKEDEHHLWLAVDSL